MCVCVCVCVCVRAHLLNALEKIPPELANYRILIKFSSIRKIKDEVSLKRHFS